MANRYWVGNGGNWSDNTNHWSTSDGGGAGASKPTAADSVFFTSSSFSSGSQTVTIDALSECLDMNWTGVTNTPTFAGNQPLHIYGSLTFVAGITRSYTGDISFKATGTGKTITLNGIELASSLIFSGIGGGWALQDALVSGTIKGITLINGALDLNNQDVLIGFFASDGSATRTLLLGSGTITLDRNVNNFDKWDWATVTNLTFDAETSTIIFDETGTNSNKFQGGGLTYNNLTLKGSGASGMTIVGSNNFNTLTIDRSVAAKTIKFTDGTTQTVTSLVITTSGTTVVTLQGTSTSGWAINDSSGTYNFSYLDITYSTAGGGAEWVALTKNGCTDSGNNSGWIFAVNTRGWMSK